MKKQRGINLEEELWTKIDEYASTYVPKLTSTQVIEKFVKEALKKH